MLFVLAAVTSAALGGVAETFVVHENSHYSTSISQTVDPSTQNPLDLEPAVSAVSDRHDLLSALITGPSLDPWSASAVDTTAPGPILAPIGTATATVTRVPLSQLPKLGGAQLFEQLGLLGRTGLGSFVARHPASIERLISSPPSASAVNATWEGFSAKKKATLLTEVPELVGNLDGVPYPIRDAANRAFLTSTIATAESRIASGIGRAGLVDERHHLEILKQIERTLTPTKHGPSRQLVTFDPTGDARAAVVVGDLATADYVSYLVPGMFFTVQGQMYDWTAIAQDLHTEQVGWLKTLSASGPSYRGKTAATVAWIGYPTPGALDIASLNRADQGAVFLGSAVQGVQAVRAGSEPYITLITHSYGSTAAMIELAKGGVSVDALAIIGSPGAAAQTASVLSVRNDNVFVGEAAWDPVVNTAFYGSDPGAASFGAHRMDVAAGTDAITHKKLAAAVGHLGYFDSGTQAMRNLALVGLGQGALVTDGTIADASRTLASR